MYSVTSRSASCCSQERQPLLPNIKKNHGRVRLFWTLMTVGIFFWLTYQLLWTYIEVVLRQEVPQPFVGDIVIFLHLVPMMAALALQPQAQQNEHEARLGHLDFVLLLTWWVYLYAFAVIPWQYAQRDEVAYGRSLNALYLTEKLVFLVALAVIGLRSSQGMAHHLRALVWSKSGLRAQLLHRELGHPAQRVFHRKPLRSSAGRVHGMGQRGGRHRPGYPPARREDSGDRPPRSMGRAPRHDRDPVAADSRGLVRFQFRCSGRACAISGSCSRSSP